MPFSTFETSVESGSPIELFEFAIGLERFYLTSSEEPVTLGIVTYSPIAVSRSDISVGSDERTSVINITVPVGHPFVQKYILLVPGSRATLTILRLHRYDTPTPETQLFFKGLVRSVAFTRQAQEAQVAVMPLTGALGRVFPRFTYQGICNHVLYDTGCKVDVGLFTYNGLNSAVVGDVYTVDGLTAKGAGWAIAGVLVNPTSTDFRLIIAQTNDQVTVLMPFPTSLVGQTLSVLAGCDHTLPTCKTKFNNVINYGGFMFVPHKNPFATGL
jgi:uncharacterized phage protein (TIGR02218 family)